MLNRSSTLLIVTDIQGKLASLMHEQEALFRNTCILIDGCRILGIPVLWLEQYPEGLGPTVGVVASHLHGITPLPKKTFSALKEPKVLESFRKFNRNQVLIAGIETHICIYQTSLELIARDIEIHVVSDAVSSRTLKNKTIGIEKIARAGGHITSVETALFELLERADGKEFKEILSLVK